MSDYDEVKLNIVAVEFALRTFADYDDENERKAHLKTNFKDCSQLKTYFGYTDTQLKDEMKLLQQKENLLLAQMRVGISSVDQVLDYIKKTFPTSVRRSTVRKRTEQYMPDGAPPSQNTEFGSKLRFRDDVMKSFAAYVDNKADVIRKGLAICKENHVVAMCFGAVGTGKTAFAQAGLDACVQYCKEPDLITMLADERRRLGLFIAFNADTIITQTEMNSTSVELSVCHRLLAEYFSLSLRSAQQIPLSNSFGIVNCLEMIATDHREQHGLSPDSKLFVYMAVDDVNKLVNQRFPPTSPERIMHLKALVQTLRAAMFNGVRNCEVSVMVAGTHYWDMKDAVHRCGIDSLPLHLQALSHDQLDVIMREDAKVDCLYLESADFRTAVTRAGPSLRAVGKGISALKYQFRESSILDAEAAIAAYFDGFGIYLYKEEALRLHALAVTGHLAYARSPLIKNSSHTLESLENDGFISLERSARGGGMATVDVAEMFLRTWSERSKHKLTQETHGLITAYNNSSHTTGRQSFVHFVARYHCLKMNMLGTLNLYDSVTLGDFYRGAVIKGGCEKLRLTLPAVNHHCEVIDQQGRHFLTDSKEEDNSATVEEALRKGDILLDSCDGASTDLMAVYSVCTDEMEGECSPLVGVIHVAPHTGADASSLARSEETVGDYEKNSLETRMNKSFAATFAAAEKLHVHISNRALPTELPTEGLSGFMVKEDQQAVTTARPPILRGAVYVGRDQCRPFFGHLFGRLITTNRGQNTNTVRKQPYCSTCTVMMRPVVCPVVVRQSSSSFRWNGVLQFVRVALKRW